MNYFHSNFKFLLEKKNIVLSTLAKNISVTRQAINEYKNGKYPNYDNLIKIAEYLDVSIDILLKTDLSSEE